MTAPITGKLVGTRVGGAKRGKEASGLELGIATATTSTAATAPPNCKTEPLCSFV